MGNYLHRTTKVYLRSFSPNDLVEPLTNYIEDPDLSDVIGVPARYWIITGDIISEMSQLEKDVIDAANLSNARDDEMQSQIDNLESVLRQLTKLILGEINILRSQHGLADRTFAQIKAQLRNDLGT